MYILHDFLERAIEGRSGVSRRDSSWGISAPLWPEAAAPRRHLPGRDRELRVEEALLLQFGRDARRRVRREFQARHYGRYAQYQSREELHGSAGRWSPAMACEGGIETTARAQGVWGGPLEGQQRLSARPRPPRARSTLFFHGLCVPAERRQPLTSGSCSANTEIASPKALSMFIDAGAVRLRRSD
jgi:hypothetical protein